MANRDRLRMDVSVSRSRQEPLTDFGLRRRTFLQVVGSGLLVTVKVDPTLAQVEGRSNAVAARLLFGSDGTITAASGKVEEGQGPRAELTQAAAEELRVPVERVRLVMADTSAVPDDGITAGSRTTPRNVPEMRQAAATARELLKRLAAEEWRVGQGELEVREGVVRNRTSGQTISYADLAKSGAVFKVLPKDIRPGVEVTEVDAWEVLGKSIPRPNARDIVTGAHRFPSDIVRPNMLYGKILRPPSFGAVLESIDLSAVRAMEGVIVAHEGQFVGFAAPSSHQADRALEAAVRTAHWKEVPQPVSNETLYAHLKENAQNDRRRVEKRGSVDAGFAAASKVLYSTYTLGYIQHAPLEPRAAVAEWTGNKLTVWAGCDGPFRARRALAEEFGIPAASVRVVIPDMGGGFGGKHTAEAALEAARLAKVAGRPVWVRWTREEEFTWAYFRPAAVIECKGALGSDGRLTAWEFTNINAGGAAIEMPYAVANTSIASVRSQSPLRQGSYRCLGATGNNFARESFMDELAAVSGTDPLEFRLTHLENTRLRRVLKTAADRFGWGERRKRVSADLGVGLACGTEKNSVVAACVEVAIDRRLGSIRVSEISEAFECGPILNPANLESQVQGCVVMGLGGALTEEIEFRAGKILNPRFSKYRVPRFQDIPKLNVHLIDNPDIPAAGGGETPIIAVAPAIGNAVFAATGIRLRSMPLRVTKLRET